MIDKFGSHASIEWNLSGEPFLTKHGALTTAVNKVIKQRMGISADLSTGGGTSDGRFIAKLRVSWSNWDRSTDRFTKSMKRSKSQTLSGLKNLYRDLLQELIG